MTPDEPLTMTSREIAALTGKEHRNVTADIRALLEAFEIDVLSFQQMYQDSYGREFPMFALPKDLTITLVSGYDVVRRHAIVTRWLELEGRDKASPKTTSKTPAWAHFGHKRR